MSSRQEEFQEFLGLVIVFLTVDVVAGGYGVVLEVEDCYEGNFADVAEGALKEEGEVLVHGDVDHLSFLVVNCS